MIIENVGLLCRRQQKQQWESTRLKRPANAYIKFIQDFMAKNSTNYDNVRHALSAGMLHSDLIILQLHVYYLSVVCLIGPVSK